MHMHLKYAFQTRPILYHAELVCPCVQLVNNWIS